MTPNTATGTGQNQAHTNYPSCSEYNSGEGWAPVDQYMDSIPRYIQPANTTAVTNFNGLHIFDVFGFTKA